MKRRRYCRTCGDPVEPHEAYCPPCQERWHREYTSPEAKRRRAEMWDALQKEAREIGWLRSRKDAEPAEN